MKPAITIPIEDIDKLIAFRDKFVENVNVGASAIPAEGFAAYNDFGLLVSRLERERDDS